MSKVIVEQAIGGDGGKASLEVDGEVLALKVSYPLSKILEPVNKVIDQAIDKVEGLIPGDWDKAVLEPVRVAAKAELLKLLAE